MKRALLSFLLLSLAAVPAARAEIAVLANGQTFKVDRHRVEGGVVWLSLRGGGEVALPPAHLRGFVPDEVLEEVASARDRGELAVLAAAAAKRHGLDPDLVMAVASVESAFQPKAVSPKGAGGLMQLMPGTARDLGVRDVFDPAQNVEGGARHLRRLIDLYAGDLDKALAAYNAGEGAVARHRGIPPYRETRHYVRKVLQRYREDAARKP